MARPRKRSRRHQSLNTHRRRRHNNPVMRRVRRRRHAVRRRRHNPVGRGGQIGNLVTTSLWAIGGMVGTRAGTQAILGAKNTGPMGYLANGVVAIVGGQLLKRFAGSHAGNAFTLGGFLGIVARAVAEYTPFGAQVTQAFQLQGLGDWAIAGFIPNPLVFNPLQSAGWPAQMAPSALTPPAPKQVSGLGRYSLTERFQY